MFLKDLRKEYVNFFLDNIFNAYFARLFRVWMLFELIIKYNCVQIICLCLYMIFNTLQVNSNIYLFYKVICILNCRFYYSIPNNSTIHWILTSPRFYITPKFTSMRSSGYTLFFLCVPLSVSWSSLKHSLYQWWISLQWKQ